tara:strand:+ start:236 stop:370 length:135 start_codon:yes stop_codon:yes gene_type:complete
MSDTSFLLDIIMIKTAIINEDYKDALSVINEIEEELRINLLINN